MSRSFKKVPGYTDGGKARKFFKRCSNKRARKNWDLSNGGSHKKDGYTYDICDWKYLCYKPSDFDYIKRMYSEDEYDKVVYRSMNK